MLRVFDSVKLWFFSVFIKHLMALIKSWMAKSAGARMGGAGRRTNKEEEEHWEDRGGLQGRQASQGVRVEVSYAEVTLRRKKPKGKRQLG